MTDREQTRRDAEATIRHALDMCLQAWRTTNPEQFREAQDSLTALLAELEQAEEALRQIRDGFDGDEFQDSADAVDQHREIARAALS